jgi:disulfide bond formation protein DsbB
MMNDLMVLARREPPLAAAAIVVIGGALTICGFLFFQYVMNLPPCPLCLEQRYAFYVSVPLAALLWLGAGHGASNKVLFLGFAVIAAAMLWNSGLGAYHAGVEWKLWAGPQDCSGPIDSLGSAGSMLNRLQRVAVVRCDEAAWRLFGISLPGWNVLVSLGLAAVAAWGAKTALARSRAEG